MDVDLGRAVRDALRHLHDPVYLETHPLTRFVGRADGRPYRGEALRRHLIDAIEALRPAPGVDDPAARRRHEVLVLRYVEGLPNPAVQARLAVSQATLYREHERALDGLVSRLRGEWGADAPAAALPVPMTRLVGRDPETAAVKALLLDPGVRVLTVTGPGGVGKTRLALRVASEIGAAFPNGVLFVPLEGVSDPALVLPSVAEAVGAPTEGGEAPREVLRLRLAGQTTLLVLDNLEQVLAAGPEIAALLAAMPGLKVLATSRAALQVYGEQEFPLRPLAVPHPSATITATAAAAADAVRLFVERARAVDPSFALTEGNAAAVVEVCRRLDGLPLALELAAARVRLYPPDAMVDRLGALLPLLSGGPRDAPARHRTMRAAIEWSYDVLEKPQRRLFRQMAVFAGGCRLDAVAAVCRLEGPNDVEAAIEALVAQSLLHRSPAGREPRVAMLATVREWGLEQLAASGEEDAVRARHAAYYAEQAERSAPPGDLTLASAWVARLEEERDNLRAALSWYVGQGAAVPGLRLALALERFWYLAARLREGRAWLGELLRLAGGAPDALRGQALAAAGRMATRDADPAAARGFLTEAAAMARAAGDRRELAEALRALAAAEVRLEAFDSARRNIAAAVALYRQLGDEAGVTATLNVAGFASLRTGDLAAARRAYAEILATDSAAGDAHAMAVACEWLGNVASAQGRFEEARQQYERAVALQRHGGDPWVVAHALQGLALVALSEGDDEAAAARLAECLPRQRALRDRAWLPATLEAAAVVTARRADAAGDPALAARAIELAGAAEAERRNVDEMVTAAVRARLDGWLAAIRRSLAPAEALAAAERGASMTGDQAAALAEELLARSAGTERAHRGQRRQRERAARPTVG